MSKQLLIVIAAMIALGPATANADTIAFDLVGSGSQNLVTHVNPHAGAFSSAGDGFEIFQRGVSSSIPFAVLDDSAVTFPPDGIGIIDDFNLGRFFGVVDTENNDNNGPVTASWVFDVSGFSGLSVSIDMGAMGDFESSDEFAWAWSIDGGPLATLFEGSADEAANQSYTLAGGGVFNLADPMTVGGTVLSNQLQTFTGGLVGAGSLLTVSLTAQTNGGNEALAFQNLIVSGDRIAVPAPGTLLLFLAGLLALRSGRPR